MTARRSSQATPSTLPHQAAASPALTTEQAPTPTKRQVIAKGLLFHVRSVALVLAALLACTLQPALDPRPAAAKPCELFSGDYFHFIVPVRVRTELVDESGQTYGKREVAPGESTQICLGIHTSVVDGSRYSEYIGEMRINTEPGGLGFVTKGRNASLNYYVDPLGHSFDPLCVRGPVPLPHGCQESAEAACSGLHLFLDSRKGHWEVNRPDGRRLPRAPEEPDIGYICFDVRIHPHSRPGRYTIQCTSLGCCRPEDNCPRNDACSFGNPYTPFCCCCPEHCQPDTLEVVPCVGDCERDGTVTIDELQRAVRLTLGLDDPAACSAADGNEDGEVSVDELLRALRNVLSSCVHTARQDRSRNPTQTTSLAEEGQ